MPKLRSQHSLLATTKFLRQDYLHSTGKIIPPATPKLTEEDLATAKMTTRIMQAHQ
jgi:hypothetical protein